MAIATGVAKFTPQGITRSDLELNLATAAYDFIRSSIASFKKVQIYPPGHQLVEKFMAKPFEQLQKIFRLKTKLSCELINKRMLVVEGLYLRNDENTLRASESMAMNEIKNIVFDQNITPGEVQIILSLLFRKTIAGEDIAHVISSNRVSGFEINVKSPNKLFQIDSLDYFESEPQFTLYFRVRELLGKNHKASLLSILGIPSDDKQTLEYYGFDVRREAVVIVAEDLLSEMPLKEIITDFQSVLPNKRDYVKYEWNGLCNGIRKLIGFVGQKHGRAATVMEFKTLFSLSGFEVNEMNQFFDDVSVGRLKAIGGAEKFHELFETGRIDTHSVGDFSATVQNLIRGNLWNPLKDLLVSLTSRIADSNRSSSDDALLLAKDLIGRVLTDSSGDVYIKCLRFLEEWAHQNCHMEKVAALIAGSIQKLLSLKRYSDALPLVHLFENRNEAGGILSCCSSLAILTETISKQMVLDLSSSPKQERKAITEIAMILGNEALAGQLVLSISHENRDLRRLVVRILTAIGDPVIKVFTKFIDTEIGYSRVTGQPALVDSEWFKIRNVITIISNARLDKGVPILQQLVQDPDRRVRLEVARALEHIQTDEAMAILEALFNDGDPQVREAAVISAGLCSNKHSLKILREFLETGTDLWPKIISSLGYIQSAEAVELLMRLNQDADYLNQCGFLRKDFDNVRRASAKALDKRGNLQLINSSTSIPLNKPVR